MNVTSRATLASSSITTTSCEVAIAFSTANNRPNTTACGTISNLFLMPSPLLRLARYRELATDVAERLSAHPAEEVVVASGGVAAAIGAELVARSASGI